jgi:leucyl/phenylalanyl-tRNA--protein transferase
MGGDLSPERLLNAYRHGIFPWYSAGEPILWWCPDPRMVFDTDTFALPSRFRRRLRSSTWQVRADSAFEQVIAACATSPRPGQDGTWITPGMVESYSQLHDRGVAHSVEAWNGRTLVGGLYGLSLGAAFFGESMFSLEPDASKVAFVALVEQLHRWGLRLVDCQVYTPHLASFGAREWPRRDFLAALRAALDRPTRLGPWRFDDPGSPPPKAPSGGG